jgi:ATP-dependent exoDNAse (exonuclease V) alpha subunit
VPIPRIKAEFEARQRLGEFLERSQAPGVPAKAFTTPEMVTLEQQTIDRMLNGKAHEAPLASPQVQRQVARDFAHLNPAQQDVVRVILSSHDTIVALDGLAGTGKTTALAAIRAGVAASGYLVEGIAPTTSAARRFSDTSGLPKRDA